ncbi:MAG: hypothetical protein IJR52_03740, partial [Selenomonadaceae bacterium]|nr:hypothetical protein [Selenomonadaceae bacterium]
MDDGRAAHAAGQRRPAHEELRVISTFEPFTRSRPREAPFSFASFLLGEQKKRRFKNSKEI